MTEDTGEGRHEDLDKLDERELLDEVLRLSAENASLEKRVVYFKRLSTVDELTEIKNRRGVLEEFAQAKDREKRYDEPFSLLIIDIDDFKKINDKYGHKIGDSALIFVASFLRSNSRIIDTPFRLGGDEMGILLANVEEISLETLKDRLTELLQHTLEEIPVKGLRNIDLKISSGAVQYVPGESFDDLFKRADGQMYSIKDAKKNEK